MKAVVFHGVGDIR